MQVVLGKDHGWGRRFCIHISGMKTNYTLTNNRIVEHLPQNYYLQTKSATRPYRKAAGDTRLIGEIIFSFFVYKRQLILKGPSHAQYCKIVNIIERLLDRIVRLNWRQARRPAVFV